MSVTAPKNLRIQTIQQSEFKIDTLICEFVEFQKGTQVTLIRAYMLNQSVIHLHSLFSLVKLGKVRLSQIRAYMLNQSVIHLHSLFSLVKLGKVRLSQK